MGPLLSKSTTQDNKLSDKFNVQDNQLDQQLGLDGRAYYNFINSLKSDQTKTEYKKCLLKYLSHNKITLGELVKLPIADTEKMLVDNLLELKSNELSTSYINLNFCANATSFEIY